MRKFIISLLLATTAATPALAARPHHDDRAQARQERQERRAERAEARDDARQQRSEARQRAEARQERSEARQQRSEVREQRSQARERARDVRASRVERVRPSFTPRSVQVERRSSAIRPAVIERQQAREQRVDRRETLRDQRQARRDQRQVSRDRWVSHADDIRRQIAAGARPDRQAPPRTDHRDHHAPRWHSDWRHDHRYDWRNHRRHHRSLFHLGVYFDPFGWGYHRWSIGWRLWPSYYSSNYWLNDPWMYRLPYAPWPYKWVRYYDDAILVNVFSGQVVDVIYDFFW